ncbi:unnamed protein product, partial [Closterium sp. NIES-54]
MARYTVVSLLVLLAAATFVEAGNENAGYGKGNSGNAPGKAKKRGHLCVDGCDYEKGSYDYWKVPEYKECMSKATRDTAPWCAAGAVNAKDCCDRCKNPGTTLDGKAYVCKYWVHIP